MAKRVSIKVIIESFKEVEGNKTQAAKLAGFASTMLASGIYGWNPKVVEVPEEVLKSARRLMNQFSAHS